MYSKSYIMASNTSQQFRVLGTKCFVFVCCLIFVSGVGAQSDEKDREGDLCRNLVNLAQDPSFISKVAADNGLNSMRFYSVGTYRQKEMLIKYGREKGIC